MRPQLVFHAACPVLAIEEVLTDDPNTRTPLRLAAGPSNRAVHFVPHEAMDGPAGQVSPTISVVRA